jgi:WD40 repeat protein
VPYTAATSHDGTLLSPGCPVAGHCLATAADRGELIIWRPDPHAAAATQAAASSPAPGAAPAAAAYGTPLPAAQHRDSKPSSNSPGSAVPFSPGEAATAAAGAGVGGDAGGWAQAGAWRQSATLRGHLNDVTDVAWAHDDAVVMSGSVDSEVMLFDVEGRKTLVSGFCGQYLSMDLPQSSVCRPARAVMHRRTAGETD